MKDRYETTVLSSEQISKILPHRYPFLLVDRVVEFEAGELSSLAVPYHHHSYATH
jgi:3-hydroxymyristoyl/3-hydroxydecanoyl-(acyl carrier protein) dehydratase